LKTSRSLTSTCDLILDYEDKSYILQTALNTILILNTTARVTTTLGSHCCKLPGVVTSSLLNREYKHILALP